MAVTRSSAKITNMPISQEIREYFSELIRPLATNGVLADIFKKFKKEIISKFEEKCDEQNRKIDELERKMIMNNIADAVA